MEGRTTFVQAGGQQFHYIPCLNERDDWIHVLADIALANLQGWLGLEKSEEEAEKSRQRAVKMGAKK
jgi:ferrochelatase